MKKEFDPENDPADSVDFKELDLSEGIEEAICAACSWELDDAGDCPNPSCIESPNYNEPDVWDDEELDA